MGFIIIYNDFLNPKLHVFRAISIWKPEMKNIPYPLTMAGISKDNNFWTHYYLSIKYLLVCTQNIGAGKNIGSSNICTPWILSGKFNFLKDMNFIVIVF